MDEEVLVRLVREATGRAPTGWEDVSSGRDHDVFVVGVRGGGEVVVRLQRGAEAGAAPAEEAWAIARCAEAGVRVPAVLLVRTVVADGRETAAMVQQRARGVPLGALLPRLDPRGTAYALAQAAEQLAAMHTVWVDGFYRYRLDQGWDFATWEDIWASAVRNRSAERGLQLEAGLTPVEADAALAWVGEYGARFPCRRPVLCHGDFRPEHLMFDADLRLTGVIDFGEFQGGPPVLDLAGYALDRGEDEGDLLLEAYGRAAGRSGSDGLRHEVDMQRVVLGLGYLAYAQGQGWSGDAARTVRAVRRSLARLEAEGGGRGLGGRGTL